MSHEHEHQHHHDHEHCAVKMAFKIAKLALQAASVAAAFCAVKEIHKLHRAVEHNKK